MKTNKVNCMNAFYLKTFEEDNATSFNIYEKLEYPCLSRHKFKITPNNNYP